jgi:histidinol-phosphate aminotransferase
MPLPEPKKGILQTADYVQGQSDIEGIDEVMKLSSNESSYGPSPRAIEAYHDAAGQLNRYPDGSQRELREAIAEVHGLDPDLVICGAGSDELIQLVTRAYVDRGDEVLHSENVFIMCTSYALSQGAEVVIAPEKDDRVDVDAILERVTPKTRLIPIANPNNPTGTYLTGAEIRRLHSELPPSVVLLLDGAYAEFVMQDDYESGLELVQEAGNVIVTRTFSKIYGLPSLRIGWAYGSRNIMEAIAHIRSAFNTSGPAMAAAAAAIKDRKYVEKMRQHNDKWQKIISTRLTGIGLEVIPSSTNFYLLRFPADSEKNPGDAAAFLMSKGIIPRPLEDSGDKVLRITVGLEHENEAVIEALTAYMT